MTLAQLPRSCPPLLPSPRHTNVEIVIQIFRIQTWNPELSAEFTVHVYLIIQLLEEPTLKAWVWAFAHLHLWGGISNSTSELIVPRDISRVQYQMYSIELSVSMQQQFYFWRHNKYTDAVSSHTHAMRRYRATREWQRSNTVFTWIYGWRLLGHPLFDLCVRISRQSSAFRICCVQQRVLTEYLARKVFPYCRNCRFYDTKIDGIKGN